MKLKKRGGGASSSSRRRGQKRSSNADGDAIKIRRKAKLCPKRERTTLRKRARLAKKAKRFGLPLAEHENVEVVTDVAEDVDEAEADDANQPAVESVMRIEEKQRQQLQNEMKNLRKQQEKQRIENLKADNEEEDLNIKLLERKLKINKRKSKNIPNAFVDDGLDYILEACGSRKLHPDLDLNDADSNFDNDLAIITGKASAASKETRKTAKSSPKAKRFEENPAVVAANKKLKLDSPGGKSEKAESKKKVTFALPSDDDPSEKGSDASSETDDGDDMSEEEEEDSDDTDDVTSRRTVMDMWDENDEDESADEDNGTEKGAGSLSPNNKDDSAKETIGTEDGEWQDIYGRRRAKDGTVLDGTGAVPNGALATKYVPPALRGALGGDAKKSEALLRLTRQTKGFLNRLSESNMKSISTEVENLYMKNSRNDMNETLIKLIMEAVVQVAVTPERLVQEHAFLVALLHANVGTEVGARFLEAIIEKFNQLFALGSNYGEGKQCDNLIQFLIHIYNFRVVNCLLIYDVMQRLADSFQEKDIELILLILRGAGFTLRRDDAMRLKSIIVNIQSKSGCTSQSEDQTRVKFMLETLMAVRNNNMHKIPNYDTSHAEHLKKVFKTFLRKGSSVQELKISLEDLSNVQLRGRWWVVGSAWSGQLDTETSTSKKSGVSAPTFSDDIMALAQKQRINTDVRKNIFSIIMTAEDYLDAFENLLRLGLKNIHEREIICVIIDCCLQEKSFNPYYAHLVQRFCEADSKYKIMVQCAFWDKFKEIRSTRAVQISNMAQLLMHLIVNGALAIAVLKVIQFSDMEKNLVRFLRQTLLGLLLHPSEEKFAAALKPVAKSPKLHMFRVGLCLFMRHFILKNHDKLEANVREQVRERVDMADTILSAYKSAATL